MKLIAVLSIVLLPLASLRSFAEVTDSVHGTCLVAVMDLHNIVMVADSKLTNVNSLNPCNAKKLDPACKAVLARKDVVVAVAGLYKTFDQGRPWVVTDEATKLTMSLPNELTKEDIDKFSQSWGKQFSDFLFKKQSHDRQPIGSPGAVLGEILVATRIKGDPYIAKVQIELAPNGKDIYARETEGSGPDMESIEDSRVTFAGSCHDFINAAGQTADPPAPEDEKALAEVRSKRWSAHSIAEMTQLAIDYQKVLGSIDRHKRRCYQGGPFDSATWAEGENGWTTNFKASCPPRTHRDVPARPNNSNKSGNTG